MAETAELTYNRRNDKGGWGLAVGYQAQSFIIDIIGMSFIPLYKVIGPFMFFVLLLLMVWGGFRLVIMVFLRVAIIMRYRGCRIWVLATFWGTLFQVAVSLFNWIDRVIEDVGRILNAEASRSMA